MRPNDYFCHVTHDPIKYPNQSVVIISPAAKWKSNSTLSEELTDFTSVSNTLEGLGLKLICESAYCTSKSKEEITRDLKKAGFRFNKNFSEFLK